MDLLAPEKQVRKITVVLRDETERQFEYILKSRAERDRWQKLPSYKEVMIEAMRLLYIKELKEVKKEANGKTRKD